MDKKVYHILRGSASIISSLFPNIGRRNCLAQYALMYERSLERFVGTKE